jgi:hypothetical protein
MANLETVEASSGGSTESFELNWDEKTWTRKTPLNEGEFPYIAEIRSKRYELYDDGTFDEEEHEE